MRVKDWGKEGLREVFFVEHRLNKQKRQPTDNDVN